MNCIHAMVPVLIVAGTASGAMLHVSVQGNDAHDGLGPEPARALRTLQAAVERAQPGDTVLVHAGTYRETVTFARSGTAEKPITVRPYEKEKVVISGCEPITGWTLHDAAKSIWKAPMPWTLGTGRNQVFVNGQVMIEARFPNAPAPGLEMPVSGLSPPWPTFGEFSIPEETKKEQPGRIVSKLLDGQPDDYWKGALYYGVHYEGWSAQTGVIEGSKAGEISVGDRTPTWWFTGAYAAEDGRGMIVGHMNALDRPGEWHWQDNTLYLIPPEGVDLATAAVEAKRRQLAFDLSGREHIRIDGLAVHAASARLQDSAYCLFDGCRFDYLSHYTRLYSCGQVERGRDTIKSGETGIFVGGHDNAFLNCSVRFSAGAGFYLRGYRHTIHNCLIDEVCYASHYVNAITDAVEDFKDYENFLVGGHAITFNTMRNAGRHFFNFYGNGCNTASRTRGPMDYAATLFAHNHLYNGMLQTRDAGFLTGYYCGGGTLNGQNSLVAWNAMHDCYDPWAMEINNLGIVYLDAGTCDVTLHHNLLWAAPGSLQRSLHFNTCCVDIREHDNSFHPDFARTCADLTPADFPEGKPFRFGHDFANPPPRPVWPHLEARRIAATACRDHSPGVARTAAGLALAGDGDWFTLGGIAPAEGWQSLVARLACGEKTVNTDLAGRAAPRHRKATDPLVLEVTGRDGGSPDIKVHWTFCHSVKDGGWLKFAQVPLGEGYRRFRAIYGSNQPEARTLEVRLDRTDGPLVGTVSLPRTDHRSGIQVYQEAVGEMAADATGTRDVFLVFRSPDGKTVGNFEYFRFEQYRGALPLQKTEVKLEVRAGGPDGAKLGELYPRFTGGADVFREMVCTLEPMAAAAPSELCFVLRAAAPAAAGPLLTLEWLSFEKAREPLDTTGLGVEPLPRDGQYVYPEPTHRPLPPDERRLPSRLRARKKGVPAADGPVATAAPLAAAPALDGKLDEWPVTDKGRTLTLAQDYDGSPSPAPASQAWVGYDAEAWYVAFRHPVANAGKLLPSSHSWGADDGVEIAFQDLSAAKRGPVLTLYGYPDGAFASADYGGATAAEIAALEKAVTCKAAVGAAEWTCEWRIPFAACGFTPRTAPVLAFNLGVRKTDPVAWVIWRGTGGATYRVANAGLLAFPAELLAAGIPTEGLDVHLDAQAADAVVADAAGKVSLWRDSSGKGRDARQPDARFQPLLMPDGMHGRPVLRFDENRLTRFELPDLAPGKIDATVLAVVSNPVEGSFENHDPRIFTASDGKEWDFQIGIAATVPGMATGGPRVMVSTFQDRWAKSVRVGCFSPAYMTYFHGDMAEILVYSRVLTPEEQARVRAYLTVKWGL